MCFFTARKHLGWIEKNRAWRSGHEEQKNEPAGERINVPPAESCNWNFNPPSPKRSTVWHPKSFAVAALHGETLPAGIFSKKFVGFQALAASI
ncbi:MAG: hypothetical protein IK066_12675 [Kiritimatiellae bacterium]|nr:hypothetical protein [Kiritimatiellia bacterium]